MITFSDIDGGNSFNGSSSDLRNVLYHAVSVKREFGNEANVGYSIQYDDAPELLVIVSIYHNSAMKMLRNKIEGN